MSRRAGGERRLPGAAAALLAAGLAACAAPAEPPPIRLATAEAPVCGEPATLGERFDETLPKENPDPRRVDAAIRHFTNAERCARGLPPLEPDPALERAARAMAEAMVRLDFFSHDAPPAAGGRLRNRAAKAGANPRFLGENIAALPYYDFQERPFYRHGPCDFSFTPEGPSIPPLSYRALGQRVVAQWMASPSHREGLLDPRYERMGAGAAVAPDEEACGMVYVDQMFGAD